MALNTAADLSDLVVSVEPLSAVLASALEEEDIVTSQRGVEHDYKDTVSKKQWQHCTQTIKGNATMR
jgi:hypothetical protein